eukprot:2720626-Pyramimonas_sp.AAC.1
MSFIGLLKLPIGGSVLFLKKNKANKRKTLASEERYNVNFFAVGDTRPRAAGQFMPLRWRRR